MTTGLIQDETAPTVSVNYLSRKKGYNIFHFVLNFICFVLAACEYYGFSCLLYPRLLEEINANVPTSTDPAGQKSSRIAYLVVLAILTMVSAIECGVRHNSSRSKQPKKIELVCGAIYYSISGGLLFILFAVLLKKFCEGDPRFRLSNSYMLLIILSAYANAAVYLAAATSAWLTLNRFRKIHRIVQ